MPDSDRVIAVGLTTMDKKHDKETLTPARRAAFDILRRVEKERAHAATLVAALPDAGLSREDRALAQEIVIGVLRWQKLLDYFIVRYSGRPIERLDLGVVLALRMGLYQLRYLSRVPQSAAVNESVKLVKAAQLSSASGLVNAVLRRAVSHPDDVVGDDLADPAERAAVELSHPVWLLDRWRAAWGEEEATALALANNQVPRHAFRVNTLRAKDEVVTALRNQGIEVRQSDYVPAAFVVVSGDAGAIIRLQEQGLIYLQDEASQLVSLLLKAKPGDRIFDLCAAPGSKTSHLAALTANQSWILAGDIHPQRLALLLKACKRLSATSVEAVALDATKELPVLEGAAKWNGVLLDAPCTGTGTLRRHPEIKWRLQPQGVRRMAALQSALITRAATLVDKGGRMVYSTCSLETEEDEAIIIRFLETNPDFNLSKPDVNQDLITKAGFVRTFPQRHGMDGFFAAVLQRR